MNAALFPRIGVFDGFLPEALADRILDRLIVDDAGFRVNAVARQGVESVEEATRLSFDYKGEHDDLRAKVIASLEERLDKLFAATGLARFTVAEYELHFAAHRDGGHFAEHVDTFVEANRSTATTDRVISTVTYLHRRPRGFAGGDFVLKPFIGEGERRFEPCHNRLLAFPSIARHAVEPVSVPGDRLEDARFAINCWLLRART